MVIKSKSSDKSELQHELSNIIQGDVRFDKVSRSLWSTDASIYKIEPVGIVLPKTEEDVIAAIEIADKFGVSVLPRGGGTSLAGQTVGESLVLDFSKYMRDLKEINKEEGWVRVQPGIILDELNKKIANEGVLFAPDPSTSNRGNVGGALGNNSCGAHSIMWGKTVDNVHELDVVLANGDKTKFGYLSPKQLENKMRHSTLEGNIYRNIFQIAENNRSEILKRYPKIQRRVSGYNLDEFVSGNAFNMARFAVGSEGTLITITEAKLKVVEIPKVKGLAVLHCNDLIESMEATVACIEMNPSAIELIGKMIIQQAKSNLMYARLTEFIEGDPEAILAIELVAESEKELDHKMLELETRMKAGGWGYALHKMTNPNDQQKVWDVRKAGLGLMMNIPGDAKPIPFVEDTAVSPEVLPEFVTKFDKIIKKYGTEAGYYGHASVGCLHIRPLINLKTQQGIDRMTGIADEISDLVLEYGGSLSGEHGDGLVRSGYNEKMFGSQLYQAFKDIKTAFDPKGIMNPGKIINSPPMTDNLRYGTNYSTVNTTNGFNFRTEGGSFSNAVEMCNGQAACRKVTGGGVMCPSYMVTRDEEHSTRGRANALRAAISGSIPLSTMSEQRMYDVMDLCLECKGCKSECPSNVDMAKIKYEFLSMYHKKNGFRLKNRFFGNVDTLSKIGSFFAPLSNFAIKTSLSKFLLDKMIGIDRRRTMPKFAAQTFKQWFESQNFNTKSSKGTVLLFPDTTTNYNHPEIAISAVNLIQKLGYEVILPDVKCCGRPMLSNGMIEKAKSNISYNYNAIIPHIKNGAKIVGIEPSCILGFSGDFGDLYDDEISAELVSKNTLLIEEFLLDVLDKDPDIQFSNPPKNQEALFHGHCHQKALKGTEAALKILRKIPGLKTSEIQAGCCGMAGSFGYTKNHFDISMDIGEQVLFPEVRKASKNTLIISEGVSCREQIEAGTTRSTKHLVEVLNEYL